MSYIVHEAAESDTAKHSHILPAQIPLPSRVPHIEQFPVLGPYWLPILKSSMYMSIPSSLTIPSPHPSLPSNQK